jgi:hypothetical protein
LLIAPLFIERRLNLHLAIAGFVIASALILVSIFYWDNLPVCYIEEVGLAAVGEHVTTRQHGGVGGMDGDLSSGLAA